MGLLMQDDVPDVPRWQLVPIKYGMALLSLISKR